MASLDPWTGLVDDAAIFPPGDAELGDAVAAWEERAHDWWAGLAGSFVVTDTRLGELARLVASGPPPVSIVVSSGAGGIGPALEVAERRGLPVAGVEVALRDPDDLPGNARRVVAAVDAARDASLLPDDTPVYVELPQAPTSAGWLAAADEVAAAELRLKLRTGGTSPEAFPTAPVLAGWIEAALDRETAYKCTAGLHDGLRHRDPATGFEHHGFVNVLAATAALFDGGSTADGVQLLEATDPAALSDLDVPRARRWFTSFGSCSVTEPLDSLLALGLLEEPRDHHLG